MSRPASALPAPSPEALAHGARVRAAVEAAVRDAGGWLPFERYMDLVLYAPGLGYYAGGAAKFGASGDFVTAPEISPLFGRSLARQVAQVLRVTGGDVLELGPGTGRLAVQVLGELERMGCLPDRYRLLDVSPDLRDRQRRTLEASLSHLLPRVEWLDALPDRFTGVVLANEVLDAVPVALVAWTRDGPQARGVVIDGDRLAWADRPLAPGPLRERAAALPVEPPYVSEVGLRAEALVAALAERIESGVLLFLDYGFGRREYYHPQRDRGTLMCHYRHHAHDDPLSLPGLQDITAHVDFTAVAEAGVRAGLRLAGYTTQAHFLVNCGIAELISEVPAAHAAAYLPMASQAQKLMSPSEMGELFKALALARGIDVSLSGFARGDLVRLL